MWLLSMFLSLSFVGRYVVCVRVLHACENTPHETGRREREENTVYVEVEPVHRVTAWRDEERAEDPGLVLLIESARLCVCVEGQARACRATACLCVAARIVERACLLASLGS